MSAVTTHLRPFGRKEPAAPLPDPKTAYERPLKRELANRVLIVYSAFYGFTWSTLFLTSIDLSKGPPLGFFGHLIATSISTMVLSVVGALPPLILRGRTVSGKITPAPTRGQMCMDLISNSHTWRILFYFATSGFSLAVVYVAWVNLSEWDDSKLSIFAPTRRNPFRLNERFIYLAFFNASLGLMFASRDIIRQRRLVVWPRFDELSERIASSPTLMAIDTFFSLLNTKAAVSTALVTVIHICIFPLWYHTLRAVVLPMLRNLPVLSGWTRPMLHGFGRTWSIDVSWSRLIALSFRTSFGWELVECAFDHWVIKPISVSCIVPNPNQTVVAGLHSKDQYFRYHAYLELCSLARSSSPAAAARRTALFTDMKTSPALWAAVVRELLLNLGRDYQCLIRRGKPPLPVVAPAPTPSVPRTPKTPTTPLLHKSILKPSPRSLFDPLASDGAVTQALTSMATLPKSVNVPSVFLPSPSTPRVAKDVVKTVQTKVADVAKATQTVRRGKRAVALAILSWVERHLPREWKVREWWTDVSVEKEAIACLPDARLDVVAIEALTHLVAASLREDTFGMVQRDIPRVLEALTSFLAETERFHEELEKKLPQDGDANSQDKAIIQDRVRAIEVVVPVLQALRSGIGLITKTFGDRLSVYKFPPVTANRLQPFMDYL
ncbi:nucleoporin protein Ndc1-Nup [Hysterangium stoloniferum]|nr:nucleoporin protein Ndc1-Nup [Hysterangium stoloniferum]